jgi:hypothetical protein
MNMKKLLLILLGIQAIAYAQTIPNGAFEKWNNINFDNPDHWYSANMDKAAETGVFPITKVNGSAGFAIKMETKTFNSDIVPAWISTSNGDPREGEGGYPYTQAPANLTGKYRCNIAAGDTGFIIAIFKKNGVIMGSATGKFTGSINSFSTFTFPVLMGGTPDSVLFAAGSSNLITEEGIQVGSWLELDELAFGGTGITQTIQNGNFENWTNTNMQTIQDWMMFGDPGISRENDPFRGSYAIKLRTYMHPQVGLRQCGIRLSKERDGGQVYEHGVPYTRLQDTLFGYYKLTTPGMDNAYIFARTFKNGNQVGWFGENLTPSASYKYFQVIINNTTAPDSMDVVVESSSQSTMIAGTTLIIDEIQLASSKLNTTGIGPRNPFKKETFSIYPNPAVNEISVLSEWKGNMEARVFNMNGEEVLHQNFGSDQSRKIDIQTLNIGLYIVYVASADGSIHFAKFIKE